jgi:hypothetical protein
VYVLFIFYMAGCIFVKSKLQQLHHFLVYLQYIMLTEKKINGYYDKKQPQNNKSDRIEKARKQVDNSQQKKFTAEHSVIFCVNPNLISD